MSTGQGTRWRTGGGHVVTALLAVLTAVAGCPPAGAEGTVMYEVRSSFIPVASIEYSDVTGSHRLTDVPLPWRLSAAVADPHGTDTTLRADWPSPVRYEWLTIRIYHRGSLLCERILDAGTATCDARGPYADLVPRW